MCLAFFGAFAWGAITETYGAKIIAKYDEGSKLVKVNDPP